MQTQARLLMQDDNEESPHMVERMAAAIARQIQKKGQCPIADLRAMGFSFNDIERYWPEACKLAEAKTTIKRI